MSAHPPHIINYIQGYRSHYPASQKLVIRSTPPDLLHRRARTQHLTPAITAVPSSCSISSDVLEMTIHTFLFGGSYQTRNLLLAYQRVTSALYLRLMPRARYFQALSLSALLRSTFAWVRASHLAWLDLHRLQRLLDCLRARTYFSFY